MPLYTGLMSGTSLDGVDAALVRFEGRDERPADARLAAFRTTPYDEEFRRRLEEACRRGSSGELSSLNVALGRRFAEATHGLLEAAGVEASDVEAVGSHGQTVWHAPPGEEARDGSGSGPPPAAGHTLQIGEAAVVAEATGVTVISDFRVRDVAAGGHGAPLTPYFDRLLLSAPDRTRGVQNLGGMGNLTVLPPGGGRTDGDGPGRPVAFDTGPGTALLDAAAQRLTGGRLRMDRDGERAAAGEVLPGALDEWRSDPFFGRAPPRSTGRERFGPDRLERWLDAHDGERPEDLLATLTELTAWSVADSLRRVDGEVEELYLCGGGARNPELRRRLADRLDPVSVRRLSRLGWDGDAREAAAFALLARQHLLGVPASPPWATGARGARVLGKRTPP